MPHEIDTTGRAAVFTVGTPPWHRLGITVADAQTSEEAIRLAALDWSVEPWPFIARHNGTDREVPDRVANIRADTGAVLGVVSRDYQIFQNSDAFAFMDSIVGDRLAMYETAGAIRGGRLVWMMARLPRTVWAADDDPIHP
jgi:phage/plasmid-like protein (TIGR03299 family)